MPARAITESFIAVVRAVFVALHDTFGETSPAANMHALLRSVRAAGHPREGTIENGVAYAVHGAGSRFVLSDARAIDLDLDFRTDAVVWDGWRLSEFSGDPQAHPPETFQDVLRGCVAQGVLVEPRDGVFTLADKGS